MVYILLADGFEDIEALEPLDILRRAGIDVRTVGISGRSVTSAHEVTVLSDILPDEIKKEDMTMLILPGGAGHTLLDASEAVHNLIDYALKSDIYIAAICASPSILGKRDILNGKKFTCFPGFEDKCHGGIFTGEKVTLDGKIITARGAGAAADFGFKLTELLSGKAIADKLRSQMQY